MKNGTDMEKGTADIRELIRNIYSQARLLDVCPLFTGREETLEELMALYTSVQGTEFCMSRHFPNISVMRELGRMGVERFGVYVDAGDITLANPGRVHLVGRTTATVVCDTLSSNEIRLLHGARAVIDARGWSVVSVQAERGCQIIKNVSGHAVIL